ncbi:hypothetical protein SprV_0802495200 [Sparganum proliferum]
MFICRRNDSLYSLQASFHTAVERFSNDALPPKCSRTASQSTLLSNDLTCLHPKEDATDGEIFNQEELFYGTGDDNDGEEETEDVNSTLIAEGQDDASIVSLLPPAQPKPLPEEYRIPAEILDSDGPASGLLAFSLSLRRLSARDDPISLLIHVFEARCVLTSQVGPENWFGRGKFYVKARFMSTEMQPRDLQLKLTLKQRESSSQQSIKRNGKMSGRMLFKLPITKKFEVGSVTVNCSPELLKLIASGPTPGAVVAPPCSTLKPFLGQDGGSVPVTQPGLLRMVREIIHPGEPGATGCLNLALQWNQATMTLTCRAIECTSISPPIGTNNIYAVFSLMNNCDVLNTVCSKPAARLSLNACEFQLNDDANFVLSPEEGLEKTCVGVAVIATMGSLKIGETLIGRLVVGPDGVQPLTKMTKVMTNGHVVRTKSDKNISTRE